MPQKQPNPPPTGPRPRLTPKAMNLNYTKLTDDAIEPTYATPGSAAMDLYVRKDHPALYVGDGRPAIFSTGLAFAIPDGWVMKIYSRSGHGFKQGVRLANSVGIIDSDYRGEVLICLTADAGGGLLINPGDRIAQFTLQPAYDLTLIEVDHLPATTRGAGGFGSTGQ